MRDSKRSPKSPNKKDIFIHESAVKEMIHTYCFRTCGADIKKTATIYFEQLLKRAGDVEMNPGPKYRPTKEYREQFSDNALKIVAKQIQKDIDIDSLGVELGFTHSEIQRYVQANRIDNTVTYMGTLSMLRDWRIRTIRSEEREKLMKALIAIGRLRLADDLQHDVMANFYIDRYSESWIESLFSPASFGKRVICTVYIPVSTPKNDVHALFVNVRDENIAMEDEARTYGSLRGYMAPVRGEPFFVRWGCGEFRITCKESTCMEDKSMTIQECHIGNLTHHKVMFNVDTRTADMNTVILHFILEQSTRTKQILVPMHLEANPNPPNLKETDHSEEVATAWRKAKYWEKPADPGPSHVSSQSKRVDEQLLRLQYTTRQDFSDTAMIRLEKHGIEVRLPPNEAYRTRDVTVEPIHDIPPELVLKETEAIISFGLRMSPSSSSTFHIPVTVTMPHCGIFTTPEAAEVVMYHRKTASGSFTEIPCTNYWNPRCVVRHHDLDFYMDHFSEIWIVALITRVFVGKRVICTPYIPVSTPRNAEHVLFVHVRNANIGTKVEHGYMAPISGEQFLVKWRSGGLRITCNESTPMEDEITTLQESDIRHLTEHKVMFTVNTRATDTNEVILHFIMKQSTTKQIIVPMQLKGITETSLGDTVSTSPRLSASTSVAIPFQDAAAAGEVSTARASDTVSDGKLTTLAAHFPHDKYHDLSDKLGIEYNEASRILKQHGRNYKGAMRQCLSIWKNKSGGSFAELESIFYSVQLGGIWMELMRQI